MAMDIKSSNLRCIAAGSTHIGTGSATSSGADHNERLSGNPFNYIHWVQAKYDITGRGGREEEGDGR